MCTRASFGVEGDPTKSRGLFVKFHQEQSPDGGYEDNQVLGVVLCGVVWRGVLSTFVNKILGVLDRRALFHLPAGKAVPHVINISMCMCTVRVQDLYQVTLER